MLESLFNKVAGLRTPTQMFFCEYCETLRSAFFYRTPPVAASDLALFANILIRTKFLAVYIASINMFKVNNEYTGTIGKICSKLPIKTSERHQWLRSGVFIVNFIQIS